MLNAGRDEWVLDSGAGPGVSSRLLISQGYQNIVGLDPSRKLLAFASSGLGQEFNPVIGVTENLPFKDESFQSALTCFALRDVRDLGQSLAEYSRVVRDQSRLCIVDVGKPDGAIWRALITIYVQFAMPRLARLLLRNRIRSNPFQMIVPTFNRLLTNNELNALVAMSYGPSRLKEFMLGGLILVIAQRSQKG